MKGGSVSGACEGYITKVVWRAILALMGAWGPHKLVISDNHPMLFHRLRVKNRIILSISGILLYTPRPRASSTSLSYERRGGRSRFDTSLTCSQIVDFRDI